MEKTFLKLNQVFERSLDRKVGELPEALELRLQEDLDLDSLDMVNLQVAIEDEFGFYFDPIKDDLPNIFETVESLLTYLNREST